MDASLPFDPKKVHRLSVPETGKAAELAELTRFANQMTFEVKSSWQELSPELRNALGEFAYSDPSEAPSKSLSERVRSFRNRFRLSRVLRDEPEVMREFLNAGNDLTEAVLDAIERESPEHQEALAEAIEETLSDINRRTMNAEEAREWNQQIFDRAFE